MSVKKKKPLEIKVKCGQCGHIQVYDGQIPCRRCKTSGSLQLQTNHLPIAGDDYPVGKRGGPNL